MGRGYRELLAYPKVMTLTDSVKKREAILRVKKVRHFDYDLPLLFGSSETKFLQLIEAPPPQ